MGVMGLVVLVIQLMLNLVRSFTNILMLVWKVIIPMIKPLRIKAMSRLGPDV